VRDIDLNEDGAAFGHDRALVTDLAAKVQFAALDALTPRLELESAAEQGGGAEVDGEGCGDCGAVELDEHVAKEVGP